MDVWTGILSDMRFKDEQFADKRARGTVVGLSLRVLAISTAVVHKNRHPVRERYTEILQLRLAAVRPLAGQELLPGMRLVMLLASGYEFSR